MDNNEGVRRWRFGLAEASLALVALAAVMGWAASFARSWNRTRAGHWSGSIAVVEHEVAVVEGHPLLSWIAFTTSSSAATTR